MKKFFKTLILLSFMTLLCIVLASCKQAHTHKFGEWVMVKEATCVYAGEQTRTCECGETETQAITAKGHTPGTAATCTTTQNCTVCDAVLVAAKGHTLGAAATCTTAQKCTACNAVVVAAKGHTPGTAATCTTAQTCTACNAILVAAKGHTPGAEATCPTTQNCTVCNAVLVAAKGHKPGAPATCTTAQKCTVCEAELVAAKGHTPGAAATCTDAQKCTVCDAELVAAKGHKPGAPATCTSAQKCTVCNAELAKALGHKPGAAATCTTSQNCTTCNAVLNAALGHKPGAAATCTTTQNCTTCNAVLNAALGHKPGTAATCTTTQNCTTCNAVLNAALGHKPGAAATCGAAQTCTTCNAVLVEALSHTPGAAATCTIPQLCTVCNAEIHAALGHKPGEKATCTTAQICTVCNAEIEAAKGHQYVNEVVTPGALKSPATAVSPAVYYKSCSCGRISNNAADTFMYGEVVATTLPPVFARFDFGTDSKGEDLGFTSHRYLTQKLTYDSDFISVSYTEDSIIVTAVKDHPEIKFDVNDSGKEIFDDRYYADSYALCYENLFDGYWEFGDELTREKKFIRFRLKNNSFNNVMAFRFKRANDSGYATTLLASCMYLQGGAPTLDDYIANADNKAKLVADHMDEDFQVYTYDINFLAALGRSGANKQEIAKSYVHYGYYVGQGGSILSNNWNWAGTQEFTGLQFFVLGAFGGNAANGRAYFTYADTRANIKKGASIEIDYILFGDSVTSLNAYTSHIQDVYNESVSVSRSISISESLAQTSAFSN